MKKPLTEREMDIVQCIIAGMTSKQIAAKLSISIKTVNNHRSNILQKCNSNNFAEVVAGHIDIFKENKNRY